MLYEHGLKHGHAVWTWAWSISTVLVKHGRDVQSIWMLATLVVCWASSVVVSQSSSAVGANALFIHGWSVIPAGEPSVEVTTVTQVCLDTHVCWGHGAEVTYSQVRLGREHRWIVSSLSQQVRFDQSERLILSPRLIISEAIAPSPTSSGSRVDRMITRDWKHKNAKMDISNYEH